MSLDDNPEVECDVLCSRCDMPQYRCVCVVEKNFCLAEEYTEGAGNDYFYCD